MTTYYGVWVGRQPGVYTSWNDCKAQVDKFSGARYSKLKATTAEQARVEYDQGFGSQTPFVQPLSTHAINHLEKEAVSTLPMEGVLTVDGASDGKSCEFQAVWYPGREKAFASKRYEGGTNNIAEFLAIVCAIKYLHQKALPLRIYTDSITAISWIRGRRANTTARHTGKITPELEDLLNKAEAFLDQNKSLLCQVEIMKWQTKQWGEIPADYGRK